MKKLFLVDAFALIFRAHYAFVRRPITTSTGFETSAIFGFLKSLQEVLKKEQPTHIAVAFDPPGGSFRNKDYSEYKANRLETPEAIVAAAPIIKEFLKAYKIPILEVPNYEADDVIGAVAKAAEQRGYTVYMMTPDKDYGQLVSPNIYMYKPKKGADEAEVLGVKAICQKYEIERPEQVIDILALWGDASDNVPGVPGIGEKTAIKLVSQYGSIEGIYSHLDELKGKIKESLESNVEQLRLAKHLVTIVTDVPLEWTDEDFLLETADEETLRNLFVQYEFMSMLKDLDKRQPTAQSRNNKISTKAPTDTQMSLFGDSPIETYINPNFKTAQNTDHQYQLIDNLTDLEALVQQLQTQKAICFDTETTGLDTFQAKVIGVSFAYAAHQAWYVAIPKDPASAQAYFDLLKPLFANKEIVKIGQNIKFDIVMLMQYGIEVNGQLQDTMLMHYLLHPEQRHNMDFLAETYLKYSPINIETLIGKAGRTQSTMDKVPLAKICEYAAEDADVTWQLNDCFQNLITEQNLSKLYQEIEAPLIEVLASMEATGVKTDVAALKELGRMYNLDLIALEDEIRVMAEDPTLNVASPRQLGIVLFEKLKISIGGKTKKTKTKQYATDEDTLVSLRDEHPIIDKILDFRGLKKLVSSYIESFPTLTDPVSHRIHTSFNQAVTTTGRLSSNNPNLQNIPIKDARGREIRKAFIATNADYVLVSADYSQIELRLMAHFSEDPGLIAAFTEGLDIHTATAAKIFHIPLEEVTKEQRNKAKTANFGIIYGISAFGLAQRLHIPRAEAKELIEGYARTYPGVNRYINACIADAQDNQYVSTLFDRKRWLYDINSANSLIRSNAERNAINAPIQGTAADIIKIAMINIHAALKERGLKSKMILQVHDELVFDVYRPELEELKSLIIDKMENAVSLRVPLLVECGMGDNWLDAH